MEMNVNLNRFDFERKSIVVNDTSLYTVAIEKFNFTIILATNTAMIITIMATHHDNCICIQS